MPWQEPSRCHASRPGSLAKHFTPWLTANPGHLGKEVGMDLEMEGEEVAVGPFSGR